MNARTILIGLFAGILASTAVADTVTPIPDRGPQEGVKRYFGSSADPNPIDARRIPQHPFMAPNGTSNLHMDAYMSDVYTFDGPLGGRRSLEVTSTDLDAECGTVTFDAAGRIVAVCIEVEIPFLYLLDPDTLETITRLRLPNRPLGAGLGAGGYFYIDNQNRAVIPNANNEIWTVEQFRISNPNEGGIIFRIAQVCDIGSAVGDAQINSALPDNTGLIWFLTSHGVVGTVDPVSCKTRHIQLTNPVGEDETASKSFSVDVTENGVFIVTNFAMYRFEAGAGNMPTVIWRTTYDRGTRLKPGQTSQGSGTTPTLVGRDYVAITDNADPYEHLMIYDRATGEVVCEEPLFLTHPRRNATFNSLIGFTWKGSPMASIAIENNYGYRGIKWTRKGRTTVPGLERIDLNTRTGKCSRAWTNDELSIPSVVSQLSLANGLLYTYTKPKGPGEADPWYFTAVDFETGETVYQQLTGTGFGYNNNFSGVFLSPSGVAYVGAVGGLVRIGSKDQ